jgi:hypothetical protein
MSTDTQLLRDVHTDAIVFAFTGDVAAFDPIGS